MDARTEQLHLRVSRDELDAIRERTERAGLVTRNGRPMVSEYVRRCALGERDRLDMRPLAMAVRSLVPGCARVRRLDEAEGDRLHGGLSLVLEELDRLHDGAGA